MAFQFVLRTMMLVEKKNSNISGPLQKTWRWEIWITWNYTRRHRLLHLDNIVHKYISIKRKLQKSCMTKAFLIFTSSGWYLAKSSTPRVSSSKAVPTLQGWVYSSAPEAPQDGESRRDRAFLVKATHGFLYMHGSPRQNQLVSYIGSVVSRFNSIKSKNILKTANIVLKYIKP